MWESRAPSAGLTAATNRNLLSGRYFDYITGAAESPGQAARRLKVRSE